MARYFFNLHECGVVTVDEEGVTVDEDRLRDNAVRQARAIMCAEVEEGRLCLTCSIEVLDEAGRTVLEVPFRDALTVHGL